MTLLECSIEGCPKTTLARGWCSTHYRRWLRHGDPLVVTVQNNYHVPLTDLDHRRIIAMRRDGHTIAATARALGFCSTTVGKVCPGRVGKVPNDRLREAFLESPVTLGEVASHLGWITRHGPETSRVSRTLGLMEDCNGRGFRSTRRLIDWETGSLIAEAIGVAPWSVLDDDVPVAA